MLITTQLEFRRSPPTFFISFSSFFLLIRVESFASAQINLVTDGGQVSIAYKLQYCRTHAFSYFHGCWSPSPVARVWISFLSTSCDMIQFSIYIVRINKCFQVALALVLSLPIFLSCYRLSQLLRNSPSHSRCDKRASVTHSYKQLFERSRNNYVRWPLRKLD